MNMLKSIGAVIAGFLTVVVLSIGTDFALESLDVFPRKVSPHCTQQGCCLWLSSIVASIR